MGKASFKLANARCDVMSVVFCDRMVLTYTQTLTLDDVS